MKLIEAAMEIRATSDREEAALGLGRDLPGQDIEVEVELVWEDDVCTVYRMEGVDWIYFINGPQGWESTEELEFSHPDLASASGLEEVAE